MISQLFFCNDAAVFLHFSCGSSALFKPQYSSDPRLSWNTTTRDQRASVVFVFLFSSKFLWKVNELKIQTSAICIFPHIYCHGFDPANSKHTRTHKIWEILCDIPASSSRCCCGAFASAEGGPIVFRGTIKTCGCGWTHTENDNFFHHCSYCTPAQAIQTVQEQPDKQDKQTEQPTNGALKPGSLASSWKRKRSEFLQKQDQPCVKQNLSVPDKKKKFCFIGYRNYPRRSQQT